MYEEWLEKLDQVRKVGGDHPATYVWGKSYANMSGSCWFLKRPQEGIQYLEKAINYYERTDHKNSAANGYNNLGVNLVLMGHWDRAQEAFERALALAVEGDDRGAEVPMILASLGDLPILRAHLEEAQGYP